MDSKKKISLLTPYRTYIVNRMILQIHRERMVTVFRHMWRRSQASRGPLQDIPRVQSNGGRSSGSTVFRTEAAREGEMHDGAM